VGKHGHALEGKQPQALCGLGSGCEHENAQNVGSAQVFFFFITLKPRVE